MRNRIFQLSDSAKPEIWFSEIFPHTNLNVCHLFHEFGQSLVANFKYFLPSDFNFSKTNFTLFILTGPYLKYYWRFASASLADLEQGHESLWSAKFKSFLNIFEQHLFYDNSVFEAYRRLWSAHRPSVHLRGSEDLSTCEVLNSRLIHLSGLWSQQASYDRLYESVEHLNNSLAVNESVEACCKAVEARLDRASADRAVAVLSEKECCGGNGESAGRLEYEDVLDELNATYIRSQNFAVYYFAEMFGDFGKELEGGGLSGEDSKRRLVVKARNLNDLITREKPLGRFGFLVDQAANKFVNFMKSYQDLLRIGLEMDRVANQNSSYSIGK